VNADIPPPKKTNVGIWIACGIGVFVVMLVIAATLALQLYIKSSPGSVSHENDRKQMGDGGSIRKGDPKEVGLPIYPGARSVNGICMDVIFPGGKQYMLTSIFDSSDPYDAIDKWYRSNLDKDFIRQGPNEKRKFPEDLVYPFVIQDFEVTYIKTRDHTTYVVALDPTSEKVEIRLMRSGVPSNKTK
jgi:hypothetical protein